MRDLSTILLEYLNGPSDYVLQVTGPWGSGKTFVYKKELEKLISKTECFHDATKKYKPIYISLFGLKSTDDIAHKIVLEFFQSLSFGNYSKEKSTKKTLAITEAVFKIGARGFLNLFKLGNLNEYITDIKIAGKKVLDTTEIVICFDDIERKDSALKIEDFIGYVNVLVDEGVKSIFLINENKLIEKETSYKEIKEKIIGINIPFQQKTKIVFDNILQTRYENNSAYSKFLRENENIIIEFCESVDNNFRVLIYSLDRWREIYSKVKKEIIDLKSELNILLSEELPYIFKFALALSSDYKESRLNHKDIDAYTNINLSLSEIFSSDSFKEQTPGSKDQFSNFMNQYKFDKKNYKFYKSIFNYITSESEFTTEDFKREFIANNHLDQGKLLPQYEIFNKLSYTDVFKYSDSEYQSYISQMIEFGEKGTYKTYDYLTIMQYCERLDNPLKLQLDKILIKLKKGLKISIRNNELNTEGDLFSFSLSTQPKTISTYVKDLWNYGTDEIKVKLEEIRKLLAEDNLKFIFDDQSKLLKKMSEDKEFKAQIEDSIFTYLTTTHFINFIETTPPSNFNKFTHFLTDRYKSHHLLTQEGDKLKDMLQIVSKFIESKNWNNRLVQKYAYEYFTTEVSRILEKYSPN